MFAPCNYIDYVYLDLQQANLCQKLDWKEITLSSSEELKVHV